MRLSLQNERGSGSGDLREKTNSGERKEEEDNREGGESVFLREIREREREIRVLIVATLSPRNPACI